MTIDIELVLDAMELASYTADSYLDTQTGSVIHLDSNKMDADEFAAACETLDMEPPGRFLRLPTKFDIHEYRLMQNFVYSMPPGPVQDELADAIQGPGAMERFKEGVRFHGVDHDWYYFRERAYRQMAIQWCIENDLGYAEAQRKRRVSGLEQPHYH